MRMTGAAPPVLEVKNLHKHFPVRRGFFGLRTGTVHAVDGISFRVRAGETLGLVGESGCGKSTTGKMILKLIEPTAGEIYLNRERIDTLSRAAMRPRRRELQVVFQDPYASLNPRLRARDIVAEPLRNFMRLRAGAIDDRVAELFAQVGLRRALSDQPAHGMSLPYALPVCRGTLQKRDAGHARGIPRPFRRVPFVDRKGGSGRTNVR